MNCIAISHTIHNILHSPHQKQVMDDRIEGVVFRVEEFKSQLEHVQHNMVCNSEKVDDLHSYAQHLKDLYTRVDQVGVSIASRITEVGVNLLVIRTLCYTKCITAGICAAGHSTC